MSVLHVEFGAVFRPLRHETEIHPVPSGQEQDVFIVIAQRPDHA